MNRRSFLATLIVCGTLFSCGTEDNRRSVLLATFSTSLGSFDAELMPDEAPLAVENFRTLASRGYYDGLVFHRVIPDFMIQGGDPTGTGTGGESIWGRTFEDEFNPYVRFDAPGRLAMANSGPQTNGSQFFITTKATPWLNDRHTIFGQVVRGLEVVDAISRVATNAANRPLEDVILEHVTVEENPVPRP